MAKSKNHEKFRQVLSDIVKIHFPGAVLTARDKQGLRQCVEYKLPARVRLDAFGMPLRYDGQFMVYDHEFVSVEWVEKGDLRDIQRKEHGDYGWKSKLIGRFIVDERVPADEILERYLVVRTDEDINQETLTATGALLMSKLMHRQYIELERQRTTIHDSGGTTYRLRGVQSVESVKLE